MFAITSAFSWQNSVSLCPAHSPFQGQIFLLLQVFLNFLLLCSSPLQWKGYLFSVLVLKGLVSLHKTIQLLLLWFWLIIKLVENNFDAIIMVENSKSFTIHNEEAEISPVMYSVHFSYSVVSNSLQPHGLQYARVSCPEPTPIVYSNSCPLSWWCHTTILDSIIPFSWHLQFSPAS